MSALVLLLFSCSGQPVENATGVAPTAIAGPDVSQPADALVTLDGRASSDADGEALTWFWAFDTVPAGSALATLESPFSSNFDTFGTTTFFPDRVGIYIVRLLVFDGAHTSPPDEVIVDATPPAGRPIAIAGTDRTVSLGESVVLDGRASFDPHGAALAYQWALVATPANSEIGDADLAGAGTAVATFIPDVFGEFTVLLAVDNGLASSEADTVRLHVSGDDQPPVAIAGDDLESEDCTQIPLDCSASIDPEGLPLDTYWELQEKPATSMAGAAAFGDLHASTTTFWVDEAGTYRVSCSVFDGASWSVPDLVTLSLTERADNDVPTVNAGSDRLFHAGEAECVSSGGGYACGQCPAIWVDLGADATATDDDGDPVGLFWEPFESDASVVDSTALSTQVLLPATSPTAPGSCTETEFIFKLTGTDCPGTTDKDAVSLVAECCGVSP